MEFDQFTTLKRGKDLTRDQFRDGSVPVAGSNGVIGFHDACNVTGPGLTVGRSGSVGRVTYYESDFWAHNTALYVSDFHGNDPLFSAFFLRFLRLERFRSGASVPTLDRNVFRSLPITVPDVTEQHKIADVLRLAQQAIEQQDRLLALTAELKKTLLHHLLTNGLHGEPQKVTAIGPVPGSWKLEKLQELIDIRTGQVDPRQSPFKEMAHVGPENIEPDTGRLSDLKSNDELRIKSGNYHFTSGDVLYSKIRPYLNKVALPEFEGTCSADMYPVRPKDQKLTRNFLFQMLLSDPIKKQAISLQDRTGIPKINRVQLQSIIAVVPSLAEQTEIANGLETVDRQIEAIHRKQRILDELFHTLLDKLMTAEIRVCDITFPATQVLAAE